MPDLNALDRASTSELALLEHDLPPIDLHAYDEVILNDSAGKDSLAMKWQMRRLALAQGYPLEQITAQHNSLGDRVAWPGTAAMGPNARQLVAAFGDRPGTDELATQQCETLGISLFINSASPEPQEGQRRHDLLDQIAARGRFPDSGRRLCTSWAKRGPGKKHITARYKALKLDRPARLLYVFGFRSAEPSRAKKVPFVPNRDVNSVRTVDEFYPIFRWSEAHVWSLIKGERLPYHWAYDAGMRRLSCSFCIMAGAADLVLAAALRPDVAREYLAVEQANVALGEAAATAGEPHPMTGRTFQDRRTMAQIIDAARTHPIVKELGLWVP